jgi:hypothetical protein
MPAHTHAMQAERGRSEESWREDKEDYEVKMKLPKAEDD